jgi:hypothetical protein
MRLGPLPTSHLYYLKKYKSLLISSGTAAISGSRISLRAPLRGGGDPRYIGKQEVGTYIYSLLYTHTGLLGLSLLWSFTVVNVVEWEPVTTWAG